MIKEEWRTQVQLSLSVSNFNEMHTLSQLYYQYERSQNENT